MAQTALVMQPMEWAPLADIDDVKPIGVDDADCLREVYDVLERHGMADRFGVTLLHKHFAMNDDEVLLERTDLATRTLLLQPANVASAEVARSIQTSWRLTANTDPVTNTACYRRCERNIHGNHEMGGHYWG